MNPPLVLASSSPYRASLLARLGLEFSCHAPALDESAHAGETPRDTALRLAGAKARAVAGDHPGALILGSDQLASLDGTPIGKPGTLERAVEQLLQASGRELVFHTAVALLDSRSGRLQLAEVPCLVGYRTLDEPQVRRYLQREPALDCAGAARIEALGISLVRHVRCDDPTALIGLPLITVAAFLREAGLSLP
ncbi:MAG: septum formation protein Maf [Pseudomonadota bacterium]|nr:septum formation protein Maf [Pseudomonadota bacterium]